MLFCRLWSFVLQYHRFGESLSHPSHSLPDGEPGAAGGGDGDWRKYLDGDPVGDEEGLLRGCGDGIEFEPVRVKGRTSVEGTLWYTGSVGVGLTAYEGPCGCLGDDENGFEARPGCDPCRNCGADGVGEKSRLCPGAARIGAEVPKSNCNGRDELSSLGRVGGGAADGSRANGYEILLFGGLSRLGFWGKPRFPDSGREDPSSRLFLCCSFFTACPSPLTAAMFPQ